MASETWALPDDVQKFLKAFCVGRSRAVKAQDLANKFQTSMRDINEAVRVLRQAGAMIGSSKGNPSGYYYPASIEEVDEYMNSFKSEMSDMIKTYRRQQRARAEFREALVQQQLFEKAQAEQPRYQLTGVQFGFPFAA